MGNFWDYQNLLPEAIEWVFTINHLYMLLYVITIILGLLFILPKKSEKGKRITYLVLGIVIAVLEILRMVWRRGWVSSNGLPINADFWWWTISFQICAISAWSTVVTMIWSCFAKKDNYFLQFMYRVLLGVSLVGAALALIYPDMIDGAFSFFHFRNQQTIVTHALLVFVPIYLLKSKRFVVKRSDLWKVAFGWFAAICISMSASLICGQNFGFALRCSLMEDIGIMIPFPFHLVVLAGIMMFISFLVYGLAILLQNRKGKKALAPAITIVDKKAHHLSVGLFIASFMIGPSSLVLLSLSVTRPSWWGIICLLPIPLTAALLYLGFKLRAKAIKPRPIL